MNFFNLTIVLQYLSQVAVETAVELRLNWAVQRCCTNILFSWTLASGLCMFYMVRCFSYILNIVLLNFLHAASSSGWTIRLMVAFIDARDPPPCLLSVVGAACAIAAWSAAISLNVEYCRFFIVNLPGMAVYWSCCGTAAIMPVSLEKRTGLVVRGEIYCPHHRPWTSCCPEGTACCRQCEEGE